MPRYTFTGDQPAILVGLVQGVNADHVAAPGNPEVAEGSTIVASPGDSVDTRDLEYLAALLQDEAPAPDPTPAPADSVPAEDTPEAPPAPVTPNPYASL